LVCEVHTRALADLRRDDRDAALDDLLRVRLSRVNDVVDGRASAEVRRVRARVFRVARRHPYSVSVVFGAKRLEEKIEINLSELPELICDVLARVCDRAVRADDDLVGLVLLAALVRLHRHDPAAAVAPLLLEAYRARRLHSLEGVRPEEVQDFRLARQKVVRDSETAHR